MKTATYNNVPMTIEHASNYGMFILTAQHKGHTIKALCSDSEVYDYFDCDYYDKSDKNWARRAAYNRLRKSIKEVVAYRQGSNWVCNFNGYLHTMPPSVRTKADVRRVLQRIASDTNVFYSIVFA